MITAENRFLKTTTGVIRKIVSDKKDDFVFHKFEDEKLKFNEDTGLYIHIPAQMINY